LHFIHSQPLFLRVKRKLARAPKLETTRISASNRLICLSIRQAKPNCPRLRVHQHSSYQIRNRTSFICRNMHSPKAVPTLSPAGAILSDSFGGTISPRLCVRFMSFRNLRKPNFSAFPLFLASLARFYWLSPHGRRLASPLVRSLNCYFTCPPCGREYLSES
jgi:hypothetical protein